MSQPTIGILFSASLPPATPGYQIATPQTDSGTPAAKFNFQTPNTGGAVVRTVSYTAVAADCGVIQVFNSPTPVTLTLPAMIPFPQWTLPVQNVGAGVLTINRNGLLIDTAAANLTLNQASGVNLATDGINYFTERGVSNTDPNALLSTIGLVIDGGGSVPATGAKGFVQVPYAGTITGWTMIADQSGSAQITVSKGTYSAFPTLSSIDASAPPNLSSAQKATSTTLTGWTTAINAGDVLSFNLDSVTTCQRIILELQVTRS